MSFVVLLFIVISTNLASSKNNEINDLNELKYGVFLATSISQAIHSIQIERGMSSGYISSHGSEFKQQLSKQRIITDKKINKLVLFLKKIKNKTVKKQLEEVMIEFTMIVQHRIKIDSLSINSIQAVQKYSQMNSKLLKTIKEISKISKIPIITKKIISYIYFLYAKETTGIERAIGTTILSNKKFSINEIFRFNELITIQKLYIENFYENTSINEKEFYNKTLKGDESKKIVAVRDAIIKKLLIGDKIIKPDDWFKLMSIKINKLKLVDDYLSEKIIIDINERTDTSYVKYYFINVINILSMISFIILVIVVYKMIKDEKRLKNITDKYIINSNTDAKGIITNVSEAFCKISGYTKEELIGSSHNIVRHPDMKAEIFKDMWKTLSHGKIWTGQVKNLKKNGGYYWVYANIEPIFDDKGKIKSYIAVRLDITNSKQLEENIQIELEKNRLKDQQLLQQSRLAQMGEMLAMIAHQWRQPLAAISSTSVSLELKAKLDKADRESVIKLAKNISNYSQHLSETIDDFRNFFKPEKEKAETSFSEIIESIMGIVEVSITNNNIKIIKQLHSDNTLWTFPNELRQVILNLIKNAEDIINEKNIQDAYIKINSYTDGTKEILEVSDNGGGVDEKNLHKIFDPYFSTKLEKNGTGLGLYMSKMIIEDHCGGELSIRNGEDGAIFKIILDNI